MKKKENRRGILGTARLVVKELKAGTFDPIINGLENGDFDFNGLAQAMSGNKPQRQTGYPKQSQDGYNRQKQTNRQTKYGKAGSSKKYNNEF